MNSKNTNKTHLKEKQALQKSDELKVNDRNKSGSIHNQNRHK